MKMEIHQSFQNSSWSSSQDVGGFPKSMIKNVKGS